MILKYDGLTVTNMKTINTAHLKTCQQCNMPFSNVRQFDVFFTRWCAICRKGMVYQEVVSQNDQLYFGKYSEKIGKKAKTIGEILTIDPAYILWLSDNSLVEFPEDILEIAELAVHNNCPPEEYFWQND